GLHLLVAAHFLVATAAHGGERRTAVAIALDTGVDDGEATTGVGVGTGTASRPLGRAVGAAATGALEFGSIDEAGTGRRSRPRLAAIRLGRWRRRRFHAGLSGGRAARGGSGTRVITGRSGFGRGIGIGFGALLPAQHFLAGGLLALLAALAFLVDAASFL